MNQDHQLEAKQSDQVPRQDHSKSEPYFQWKYKFNESTCKYEYESVTLSDNDKFTREKLVGAMKRATGTTDLVIGETILRKIAKGMSDDKIEMRLNDASSLLPALKPQDEVEALLLGQFLALHDSAMKSLRLANLPDQGFYHEERLFNLAHKLLNTANQTMQTVLKYRSGGKQTVQVIHVRNEGKAIIAQNVSSPPQRRGI